MTAPTAEKALVTVCPDAIAPEPKDQLTVLGVKLTSAARPKIVPVRKWVKASEAKIAACPTCRLESDTDADIGVGLNEMDWVSVIVAPGAVTTLIKVVVSNAGRLVAVGVGVGFGNGAAVGLGAGRTATLIGGGT